MANLAKTSVAPAAVNGRNGNSLISDEKFRQLYRLALRLNALAPSANGAGSGLAARAAALAGLMADLREGDRVIADHGPAVSALLLRECPGLVDQPGQDFTDRVVDAMGAAAVDRLRMNKRVTLVLFPCAADPVAKARSLAAAAGLPVLFVDGESAPQRAVKPAAGDMLSITVDAQDVIALYRVAHEAIARAREGYGPARILCLQAEPRRSAPAVMHAGQFVGNLEKWLLARGLPARVWSQQLQFELDERAEPRAAPGAED